MNVKKILGYSSYVVAPLLIGFVKGNQAGHGMPAGGLDALLLAAPPLVSGGIAGFTNTEPATTEDTSGLFKSGYESVAPPNPVKRVVALGIGSAVLEAAGYGVGYSWAKF